MTWGEELEEVDEAASDLDGGSVEASDDQDTVGWVQLVGVGLAVGWVGPGTGDGEFLDAGGEPGQFTVDGCVVASEWFRELGLAGIDQAGFG